MHIPAICIAEVTIKWATVAEKVKHREGKLIINTTLRFKEKQNPINGGRYSTRLKPSQHIETNKSREEIKARNLEYPTENFNLPIACAQIWSLLIFQSKSVTLNKNNAPISNAQSSMITGFIQTKKKKKPHWHPNKKSSPQTNKFNRYNVAPNKPQGTCIQIQKVNSKKRMKQHRSPFGHK